MKTILSYIFILLAPLLLFNCKGDSASNNSHKGKAIQVEESVITEENSLLAIIKNMTKVKPAQVMGMKKEANVIINHRYKETAKQPYIILDKDLWEYEFVFNGKQMTKPGQLAGTWIDFNEDQTYTYGYYEEQQGSGIYTFSLDSGLLLLIDNSDNVKPQEFEAKLFDKTLIMDGNEIYLDNNYNAKLRRIDKKPIKVG